MYLRQAFPGLLRLTVGPCTRSYHVTPQICSKCGMALTSKSVSKQLQRCLESTKYRSPTLWACLRESSSVPPRMDPDIERLQRSMKGMRTSKAEKFDGDRLIYEVGSANYLHFVTASFYATALFGLYTTPDFIVGAWESDVLQANTVMTLVMLFSGIVVLPVLLRYFARRLIFKLYYNEARDTYIAVISRTFFGVTKTRFKGRDVLSTHENSLERIFRLTSFKVNGRPFFVNSGLFKLPSDYNRLMGMI
ncbi:putative transmembrane protein [Apostichopus japonicus]|uniref:Putative transmembrane protein n=1 Tax=Stichopus japonicus TaxID=307972 RepID=A0A2G8LR68_STIJA|nr:putative transmembrane protein [Apostichopus japonicus]